MLKPWYHELQEWREAAKGEGCRVKTVTRSKHNTYYQAINGSGQIVGYFNNFQVTDPQKRVPGGGLVL